MRKKLLYIALLLIIISLFTGCKINFKRELRKGLPQLSEIKYIDIDDRSNIVNKRFDDVIKIDDVNEIKKIYDLFKQFKEEKEDFSDEEVEESSTTYFPEINLNIRFVTEDGETHSYYLERTKNETYISNGRNNYLIDYDKAIEVESLILSKVFKYVLDNFHIDEVQSIRISDLSQYGEAKIITDKNRIKNLYYYFYLKGSNVENPTYNPENSDVEYNVFFINNNGDEKLYYVYSKGNNYYISVEKEAIYNSTMSEFMDVESYFKF